MTSSLTSTSTSPSTTSDMSSENQNDSANTDSFVYGANSSDYNCPPTIGTTTYHVMVLEHGITGNSKEMGYLKKALERAYEGSSEKENSKLLVHSAKCNEKNSLDGIEAGGLRFANEINDVVRGVAVDIVREYRQRKCSELSSNKTIGGANIALSIMGNSMGGLYGRFALRYIDWIVPVGIGSITIDVLVVPHVFVTIATPHLGIKDMTYWKVPAFLEPLVAGMFGQSGQDLFRRSTLRKVKKSNKMKKASDAEANGEQLEQYKYNSIIEELSLDPEFIRPLSRFTRRIAYANAFSTDIAVPTATAAFLADDDGDDNSHICSENSDYSSPQESASRSSLLLDEEEEQSTRSSHMFVPEIDDKAKKINNYHNHEQEGQKDNVGTHYSSVRFDTAATHCDTDYKRTGSDSPSVSDMARTLDSLGWSKVFIDARPHIPALWKRPDRQRQAPRRKSFEEFFGSEVNDDLDANQTNVSCYSSGELKRRLSGNGFDGNTLPFGHSFLVASTRDPVHKMLYKSARPFVDQVIAKEVVKELLLFVPPSDDYREE